MPRSMRSGSTPERGFPISVEASRAKMEALLDCLGLSWAFKDFGGFMSIALGLALRVQGVQAPFLST